MKDPFLYITFQLPSGDWSEWETFFSSSIATFYERKSPMLALFNLLKYFNPVDVALINLDFTSFLTVS